MSSRRRIRRRLPRAQFLPQHTQFGTHILCLRNKPVIPVLLGNTLPRPDRTCEEYEEYCRAMLLLFKPWRILRELKGDGITWHEVFEREKFSPKLLAIIRNMNIENECKDARDAHAALVREHQAKPHIYGDRDHETQIDMDAFDEALLGDASL
ncbi:hypothetical protein DEU56DRAFT_739132, partial [Suillus clintonianus]|uniref:uncharacterized protein n=1 Tax=Suillus clintonianus TaxID=1904413 RepID=UPI001B86B9F5